MGIVMFSAEDAKEIFQLLASEGDLKNPLIPSARGDGFVSRNHTRKGFEDLVTKGKPIDPSVFINTY